jgi:outer membrane lipase/esterase
VIPLDVFDFLHEITADPATYGFTNVTTPACGAAPSLGCNPANFVDPNAAETYAFADGVHPTTARTGCWRLRISILEAPGQIAVLPQSEAMSAAARADRVGGHLAASRRRRHALVERPARRFQRYGDGDTTTAPARP